MISLAKAFAILTILNGFKSEYDKALADGELSFEEMSDLVIGFVVGLAKALLPGLPDEIVAKLGELVEALASSKAKVEAKVEEVSAILEKADTIYEKFEAEIQA